MTEVPVALLDARQQKLLENARAALQRGNCDYACEATAQVLRGVPSCVAARKLQRVAQLRQREASGQSMLAKVASGISSAPFLFGAAKKDPAKKLELAEAILKKHPENVGALKLLASAAEELGWPETAVFALEAVREIEPDNRDNLLALADAWVEAGHAEEALRVADELLRLHPSDGAAQDLVRKASVAQAMAQGRRTETRTGEPAGH